jgi:hypothetical protein
MNQRLYTALAIFASGVSCLYKMVETARSRAQSSPGPGMRKPIATKRQKINLYEVG